MDGTGFLGEEEIRAWDPAGPVIPAGRLVGQDNGMNRVRHCRLGGLMKEIL